MTEKGKTMSEDIKNLIEKIQEEGVQAAEDEAGAIKSKAREQAEEIVADARAEAEKLLEQAQKEVERLKESTEALLGQAARDTLLGLKKQIQTMLDAVIIHDVKDALSAKELTEILTNLIKAAPKGADHIQISISKKDLSQLEKTFVRQLKEDMKEKIELVPSDDISTGFIISYDAGKSHFDFTDKALAEYISTHLKPKLDKVLKTA